MHARLLGTDCTMFTIYSSDNYDDGNTKCENKFVNVVFSRHEDATFPRLLVRETETISFHFESVRWPLPSLQRIHIRIGACVNVSAASGCVARMVATVCMNGIYESS